MPSSDPKSTTEQFRTRKPRQGQAGLSLIELMIAVGIMGVVLASTGHMLNNLLTGVKTAEFRFSTAQLTQEVSEFLRSSANCEKNFKNQQFKNSSGVATGTSADFIATKQLLDSADVVRYNETSASAWQLKLKNFSLTKFTPAVAGSSNGKAELQVEFAPVGQIYGSQNIKRNINIYTTVLSTDPGSSDYMKVQSCAAQPLNGANGMMAAATFHFRSGPNPSLRSGTNLKSVTNPAATSGQYVLSFETPLTNSDYIVITTVGGVVGDCCLVSVASKTNDNFIIEARSTGKNNKPAEAPFEIYGAVFESIHQGGAGGGGAAGGGFKPGAGGGGGGAGGGGTLDCTDPNVLDILPDYCTVIALIAGGEPKPNCNIPAVKATPPFMQYCQICSGGFFVCP